MQPEVGKVYFRKNPNLPRATVIEVIEAGEEWVQYRVLHGPGALLRKSGLPITTRPSSRSVTYRKPYIKATDCSSLAGLCVRTGSIVRVEGEAIPVAALVFT